MEGWLRLKVLLLCIAGWPGLVPVSLPPEEEGLAAWRLMPEALVLWLACRGAETDGWDE